MAHKLSIDYDIKIKSDSDSKDPTCDKNKKPKTCSLTEHKLKKESKKVKDLKAQINTTELELYKKLVDSTLTMTKEEVYKVAEQIVVKIKDDEANKKLSFCSIACPRLNGSNDTKTKLAHNIAQIMDGIKEDAEKKFKIWAYVKYTQMLSKNSRQYNDILRQIRDEEKLRSWELNNFKKSRSINQADLWQKMRSDLTVSERVKNPTPMPVTVAPLTDLQPFFTFLTNKGDLKNQEELKKLNNVVSVTPEMIQFTRGVFYKDGRIDLCKQTVASNWIGNLMKSIESNNKVNHFLLGNNIIDQKGAADIGKYIETNNKTQETKIKTWYLAGNCIDAMGIKHIADALQNDVHATALWLKRNPIRAEGCKYLGEMLKVNKTLQILDLHNCGIFDEGVKYIFEALEHNNTLKHLYIDANAIGIEGAKYIAKYFEFVNAKHATDSKFTGLRSLWMEMNRFDNAGAALVTAALKNNKTLKRLAIGSNRIDDEGVKIVLENLQNHPKLIYLSFGTYKSTADMGELTNKIGLKDGPTYVAQYLEKNKVLKMLNININDIGMKGVRIIFDALKKNNTLLHLEHYQYGLVTTKEMNDEVDALLDRNCMTSAKMSFKDFKKTKFRQMKHTKQIFNIDSVYRNSM